MSVRYCLLVLSIAAAGSAQDQVRLGFEANWRVFSETVERHAAKKPDVIVTPECFLDGYAASAADWTPEKFAAIAQEEATGPKGKITAKLQSNRPDMLVVGVDLSQVTSDRHMRDRRPELYKDLALPH